MKNRWFAFGVVGLLVGLLLVSAGCAKASADDAETKAIAEAFVRAVFIERDAAKAMGMTSGVTTYGYVSEDAIKSTIVDDTTKKCSTDPNSIGAGKVASGFNVPALSSADKERGATERVAWFVGSTYSCAGSIAAPRTTAVILDKANGKWAVSKVILYYGVDYWD
ncbi:MAG: hypothetical protein ACYC6L_08035 [Anaerolineae bacterium]